jgi:hypothetical protein
MGKIKGIGVRACERGAVGASWWRCEDGGGAILLRRCRGEWGFVVGICGFWFRVGWVLICGFLVSGWVGG